MSCKSERCTYYVVSLSRFKRQKPTSLVLKILQKIIDNPNEEKFKSLGSTKLKQRWGMEVFSKVEVILQAIGFQPNGDRLTFVGNDTTGLEIAKATIVEKNEEEEAEMEAQRAAIKQKTKAKSSALQTKEEQKKQALLNKMELDRKNYESKMKDKPKECSKANKLQFGRKDVKVEFKNSGG